MRLAWLARGVILVLIVTVVAALLGLVFGGSLDALAATKFRYVWLLVGALVIQVGFTVWDPTWLSESGDLAILLGTNAIVALFLALNRSLPGMWIAAVGMALNVVVIGANGAMPVSLEAAEIAGSGRPPTEFGLKHERLTSDTLFPWLADVIPLPGLNILISAGDVVLAVGIGWLVYRRTVDEPEETEARPAEASD